MTDNEKGEENTPYANDWEVLSLTASTYAAAPGPVQVELNNNNDESNTFEANDAKTSEPMLMSGHFDFPQKEPKKFHMDPETTGISSTHESKDVISEVGADVGGVSKKKNDDNWNEIHFFNDDVEVKGNATFEELNLSEKEVSLYKSESIVCVEEIVGHEQVDPSQGGYISDKKDENDGSEYPCEAWWKKQATALYAQAKEANAFWSIFVAATVMGLVILGQHWQLERWQILQLRWHFSVSNDKMSWMLSPLSRLKDVILGGNRRVSLPRSSSSTDK